MLHVLQGSVVVRFSDQDWELGPGDYAINPRGAWHTADADEPVVALFITPGKGTTNRAR